MDSGMYMFWDLGAELRKTGQKTFHLFRHCTDQRGKESVLKLDPSISDETQIGLLDILCETYDSCMNEIRRPRALPGELSPPTDFVTFFGLRDFMHFIKLLGRLARDDQSGLPTISRDKIEEALERNMNGVEPHKLAELIGYFMFPYFSKSS